MPLQSHLPHTLLHPFPPAGILFAILVCVLSFSLCFHLLIYIKDYHRTVGKSRKSLHKIQHVKIHIFPASGKPPALLPRAAQGSCGWRRVHGTSCHPATPHQPSIRLPARRRLFSHGPCTTGNSPKTAYMSLPACLPAHLQNVPQ